MEGDGGGWRVMEGDGGGWRGTGEGWRGMEGGGGGMEGGGGGWRGMEGARQLEHEEVHCSVSHAPPHRSRPASGHSV